VDIIAKFEFGIEVQDLITGFKGVVGGHARYITGCDQYLVQPTMGKDGKYPDSAWVDEGRLKVVKKGRKVNMRDVESDSGEGCDSCQAPTK
jgi:hypothetical protein